MVDPKTEIYHHYSDVKKNILDINYLYFKSLLKKLNTPQEFELVIHDENNKSNVFSFHSLDLKKEKIIFENYHELKEASQVLKEFELTICKMQAGLGTSVKRDDLILKYDNRKKLGAKGTDLFIKYKGEYISIAEAQLQLAMELSSKEIFKKVNYVNLVNIETKDSLNAIWQKKDYKQVFNSNKLSRLNDIEQLLMPTLKENSLCFERLAPAGHAFLGFDIIYNLFFEDKVKNELFVIGNGEDLRSTPDEKILGWMAKKSLPIVMMTTTKTEEDKKGGQLALVKGKKDYVTIIEKAQAEKQNQLELFEQMGLRENDNPSFFNTNIVLINKLPLKELLNKYIKEEDLVDIISPDLIKNIKSKDNEEYIQLEGAIGSAILNLDKYFRQNFDIQIISFLNLGSKEDREKFFMPIKKREDFDQIYGN